jgi:hypothetical protein
LKRTAKLQTKPKDFITLIQNEPLEELLNQNPPSHSSIYPSPSSDVMAAYLQNQNPRLTIPLALTLFSAMELLGLFYTGMVKGASTSKNIKIFLNKVSKDHQPTEAEATRLVKIYRNGLAHQYFSKGESSLVYSVDDDPGFRDVDPPAKQAIRVRA